MIEYTRAAFKGQVTWFLSLLACMMAITFGIGWLASLLPVSSNLSPPRTHRIDIHRDCEVLNTFMTSDGRRFYCAPWVEEPTTPTPRTTDQETQA